MTAQQRISLGEGGQWVDQAGKLLANLGFQLIEAEGGPINGGHLLVAIRPSPTLQHFDPEHVAYWVTEGGRGRAAQLDRESRTPVEAPYAWGRIVLSDRLGVTNQFVSFGGLLRVQMTGDGTMLCDFGSQAPILRWSGHSQGTDALTAEVGAFFGRVKIPIDFVPGAEQLIARAAPKTLYCAFVQDVRDRLTSARRREANRLLAEWAPREAQRLDTASPEQWKAALELRRELGLIEAAARQ